MKKLLVAIVISVVFLGCGGGGGGSSAPKQVLGEATTANAFKAYDVMSVATYLPSFVTKLQTTIANDGVDAVSNCNVSGKVSVSYGYNSKDAVYGENSDDIIGTYLFDKCTINLSGNDIYLNGTLNNVTFVSKRSESGYNLFFAEISDGFVFSQKNPNQETNLVYEDLSKGNASAFLASYNQGNFMEYSIVSTFNEKNLGNAYIKITVGENKNKYYADMPDGVYYQGGDSEHINQLRWDTGYLMVANEIPQNKLLLLGEDGKTVEVWQDKAESVFAQTEDTYDTSFTTYTPSF